MRSTVRLNFSPLLITKSASEPFTFSHFPTLHHLSIAHLPEGRVGTAWEPSKPENVSFPTHPLNYRVFHAHNTGLNRDSSGGIVRGYGLADRRSTVLFLTGIRIFLFSTVSRLVLPRKYLLHASSSCKFVFSVESRLFLLYLTTFLRRGWALWTSSPVSLKWIRGIWCEDWKAFFTMSRRL
jgi:hypothetical protein